MDIITTHTNTDLDALASMVAAQKIYPQAVLVFPGKLSPNVEEFMSLYKDALLTRTLREIEIHKVKRVVLVDTKNPRRLARLADILNQPEIEVHIYDHHPWAKGDVRGKVEVVEMVGATTTLLVEKIRKQDVPLTSLEATILALGIYEDTGSLVFTSTTSRDVSAVAFLLEKGANLGVVSDFLGRPFSEEQKSLLKKLLLSAERHQINGVKTLICTASAPEFIVGLDVLTHTLSEIERPDAVFTVVKMEDRVYIVGRSNTPQVNAGEILAFFNGGGHGAAASATIKGAVVKEVAAGLLSVIGEKVHPPLTCRGIMSSPVKTIGPDTAISEAGQVMLRYGHTGLPVVKGEQLAGIISRRDVEKAIHHGLGHAPVSSFMTNNVIRASPGLPVAQVQKLMIEHDIGRVPVVHEGRLIGIVSRTDVLRTLHGNLPSRHQLIYTSPLQVYPHHIKGLLEHALSPFLQDILDRAEEISRQMGCLVYAAGGVVRDILLNTENLDLDLVVEGDGVALAMALGEAYDARVRVHPHFGTAEVIFPDDFKVDVATARVEFYEYPAALPKVESSSLRQDLYRRDFTINAMAVALDDERFGELIDYFGGRQDLQDRLIRVLYNLSFIEDPTRILRAVRFEQRYAFTIESQTLRLLKEAVNQQVLLKVSAERIWEELKHILMEPRAGEMLARLDELQVWPYVFPGVSYREVRQVLENLHRSLETMGEWSLFRPAQRWLCCFIGVLHQAEPEVAGRLCDQYHLKKRQKERVIKTLLGWHEVAAGVRQDTDQDQASELARRILALPRESYPLLLAVLESEQDQERLRLLLTFVLNSRPRVDGKFIKSLGYRPGPIFRQALDAVWQARLEGKVKTREEEIAFIRDYLCRQGGKT
jgi:tRNA nucleotidyltransferase (CCA-adding enzyme)